MSKARPSSFGKSDIAHERALIYCRVSSDRQASEGHGLESQEQRCKEFADRQGYVVDQVFRDTYTGGGDYKERPAMSKLLGFLDSHPYRNYAIIFDDLKRLARDTQSHMTLREELRSRGAVPESPNYNFDETPEGVFIETVHAAHNQLEREQNRRQVIQKQRARLEAGYWSFGAKRGYEIIKSPEHGKLSIPQKGSAEVLRNALEGFANGVFVRKIDACEYLVREGFWKTQRPEKYIEKFSRILSDPFYAGFIEYPVWEVTRRKGKHEGIISQDIFEANQKRLKRGDVVKRIRRDVSSDFPMRGLVVCDRCGVSFTAAWSRGRAKKYGYYSCHKRGCSVYGKSIAKKEIEDGFGELLKRHTLKPKVERVLGLVFDQVWKEEISDLQKARTSMNELRKDLKVKEAHLTEKVLSARSQDLQEAYERQLENTVRELKEMGDLGWEGLDTNIPYRTALAKATALLRSPYLVWESLEVEEKQKLFNFIFEEKIQYDLADGYRTEKTPQAIRLFEEFVGANAQNVEVVGIEPTSRELAPEDLHG